MEEFSATLTQLLQNQQLFQASFSASIKNLTSEFHHLGSLIPPSDFSSSITPHVRDNHHQHTTPNSYWYSPTPFPQHQQPTLVKQDEETKPLGEDSPPEPPPTSLSDQTLVPTPTLKPSDIGFSHSQPPSSVNTTPLPDFDSSSLFKVEAPFNDKEFHDDAGYAIPPKPPDHIVAGFLCCGESEFKRYTDNLFSTFAHKLFVKIPLTPTYYMKNEFRGIVRVSNSLIEVYARDECIKLVLQVFDKMTQRTLVLWHSIIVGFSQNQIDQQIGESVGVECKEELQKTTRLIEQKPATDGKAPKDTADLEIDRDVEIRNRITKKFHSNPNIQIELKDLSELDIGDLDTRLEVLEFLNYWGLINFLPFPSIEFVVAKTSDDGEAEKISLLEKFYHFETLQSCPPPAQKTGLMILAMTSGLFPESTFAEELVKQEGPTVEMLEYHCNSCSGDCSRKLCHCQKQADLDLCTDCFNNRKFGSDMSSLDFILMEQAEAAGFSNVVVTATGGGKSQIKALAGSTIGGEDLLQNMMRHLLPDFENTFKSRGFKEIQSMALLRVTTQDAIPQLSSLTSVVVILGLGDGVKTYKVVDRSDFEEVNKKVFKKCEILVIPNHVVPRELATIKIFFCGLSQDKFPVIIVQFKQWDPGSKIIYNLEDKVVFQDWWNVMSRPKFYKSIIIWFMPML